MSNHLTFLLLRSDCDGSITFPRAWTVGKATTPKSSLFRRGIEGVLCPGKFANKRWKSSGLKCTEQMAEFFEGSHFALFCFTKSTHFFRLFFACGRSSPQYGIEWSAIPFSKSGVLLQPPATHLVGIFAANSSRATQPLQWNDWRRSTFCSWVDVTTALDPFSPELGRATTWHRFRAIFEFSAGHKKLRIQPNSKFFSQN